MKSADGLGALVQLLLAPMRLFQDVAHIIRSLGRRPEQPRPRAAQSATKARKRFSRENLAQIGCELPNWE